MVLVGGSSPRGRGKLSRFRLLFANHLAHPRVGGENRHWELLIGDLPGSSPRGRGKRSERSCQVGRWGLIPAWAGKTVAVLGDAADGAAHPRVGGENAFSHQSISPVGGSSPRGRGKPPSSPRPSSPKSAHPRVGGENAEHRANPVDKPGSSPRGRGKPWTSPPRLSWLGLIPAWAGKTVATARAPRSARAHPRVGGENSVEDPHSRMCFGSSPRGRGKLRRGGTASRQTGLIPAWAGKTVPASTLGQRRWAHPRVGGENHPVPIVVGVQ